MAFNFVLPCEVDISGNETNGFPNQITKIKPNSVSVSILDPLVPAYDFKGRYGFQQMAFSKASDDTKVYAIYDDTSISYYDQTTNILKASLNGSNLNFFDDVSGAVLRSSYYNEGIDLYDTATDSVVCSLKNEGLSAKVYSTVQATLNATCSLSLLQGTSSGFYTPIFDSGLTYNPSTNILSVGALAITNNIVIPANATQKLEIGSGSIVYSTSSVATAQLDPNQLSFTAASIMNSAGFRGGVYHTDQPTTNATYYVTFVQSGGVSGYYAPTFDSSTLTYNPSTNLMTVSGLQLNAGVGSHFFTGSVLTLDAINSSNREFSVNLNTDITGLVVGNRRLNGVYKVYISNGSGASRTINSVLTGPNQNNKTSFPNTVIAQGTFYIMTIVIAPFNIPATNCITLTNFV